MNRALLKKCLIEVRLSFLGCLLVLFAFCCVRVWIVSSLEMSTFANIFGELWDKWERFFPVPLRQVLTYTGRIAITYDEPIVVFGLSIFAISRGSDAVSGELGRGTMEMLLAQPISRLQVLYTQALVTVTAIVLLALGTWLGTLAGIHTCSVKEEKPVRSLTVPLLEWRIPLTTASPETIRVPMRERVQPSDFLIGAANLGCLGICLAGVSTLVSACESYRWRTIGLIVAFFVISLVLKIVALAFDGWEWLRCLSIFTAYEPQFLIMVAANDPQWLKSLVMPTPEGKQLAVDFVLGPAGHCLTLLAVGGLAYLAAGVIFHRRDLPAPL